MNSLEAMMGLDQNGYPVGQGYSEDPMIQMGLVDDREGMMEATGMPPLETPYELAGMEAPQGVDAGRSLAYQMLGGPSPQVSQAEINALAQSLGIGADRGIIHGYEPSIDPMFSPRFDAMKLLGGTNG